MRQDDPSRERRHEQPAALGEWVRGEAHTARRTHHRGDLTGSAPGVTDLAGHAERQIMALLRTDLGADEEKNTFVYALQTVASGAERVVVGQQYGVGPRTASGVEQFGHGGGPIRIGRMHVDHARDVESGRWGLHAR